MKILILSSSFGIRKFYSVRYCFFMFLRTRMFLETFLRAEANFASLFFSLTASPSMFSKLVSTMFANKINPIFLVRYSMFGFSKTNNVFNFIIVSCSVFVVKFRSLWMWNSIFKPIDYMRPQRISFFVTSWIIRSIYSKTSLIVVIPIVPIFRRPYSIFSYKSSFFTSCYAHFSHSYEYILSLKRGKVNAYFM